MNKSHIYKINLIIIFSFIVLAILSVSILSQYHSIFISGDLRFHLKRIMELKYSILNGEILPSFSFNEFRGSAVMTLYPYISLLPIAFLSLFVRSSVLLVYLFFIITTFTTLILSFYCSKEFSKSYFISYLFSVCYGLSAIFTAYYFENVDFGELLTAVFLPLVIFGFLELFNKSNNDWIQLPVGLSLVVYSHVLSIIIVSMFITIWTIINFSLIKKYVLRRITYSIFSIISLTAIIWLPAIDLFIHNINNIEPVGSSNITPININTSFISSLLNHLNFVLGLFALIGVALSIICYKIFNRYLRQMFWMSLFILFLSSNIIPWERVTSFSIFKLFKVFQFTTRFCIIPQILLSYLFANSYVRIIKSLNIKRTLKFSLLIIMCLMPICLQLSNQYKIINSNKNDEMFSDSYIKNHLFINHHDHTSISHNGSFIKVPIREKIIKFNVNRTSFGYNHPRLKITNNKQFNLYCESNLQNVNVDYYATDAIPYFDEILNNDVMNSKMRKISKLSKVGFNKFKVNNTRNKDVVLPILLYNDEHIKLYDNGRLIRYKIKHGLIETHLYNTCNLISIKYIPNYFILGISVLFLLLGIILVLRIF